MSTYNTVLSANNTDLQSILDTINSLPNAGSGDPVLQDKIVTPSISQQAIAADSGYDGLGTVTIEGDSDLVAGNIKSGINIFGVAGTYTGDSSSGSVGTCTVKIDVTAGSGMLSQIAYTKVVDGEIDIGVLTAKTDAISTSVEITDCLCSSVISVSHNSSGNYTGVTPDGCEAKKIATGFIGIISPTTNGAVGTVSLELY